MNRATLTYASLVILLVTSFSLRSDVAAAPLPKQRVPKSAITPISESQRQFKVFQSCLALPKKKYRSPKIHLLRARKIPDKVNTYLLLGTIEGICLKEAGYYEDNEKKQTIKVSTSPYFQSISFETTVRNTTDSEIRVGTLLGDGRTSTIDFETLTKNTASLSGGKGLESLFHDELSGNHKVDPSELLGTKK